ncbi:2TM domain-containing protein [Hydrogenophaga sp. 5NK40-0174]|uniref:2TM domain-containing protein n=1 Tax=Hydrogenophaga sp. 5NK40-0174 TaxID=3127649 RepID=UPI003103CA1F
MNAAFNQSNTNATPDTRALTETEEKAARRAASMKLSWAIHLAVFAVVNAVLWFKGSDSGWLGLPTGGWIIGLAVHTLVVWMQPTGLVLRESLIEREREAIRRRRG